MRTYMTKPETPIDEISHLPLLIVPDERVLPVLRGEVENVHPSGSGPIADWNHVYHPRKQVLRVDEGGEALRNARLQLVLRDEQHNAYHAAYEGPPLPETSADHFKHTVLSAAGYIPLRAMLFTPRGPKTVMLKPEQHKRLHTSGEVRTGSFTAVQRFMRDYVLAQPTDHIQPRTVNRFLRLDPSESVDARKKYNYLTNLLLSLVIDRVEEPLFEPYTFGHNHGLLASDAPPRPDYFVRSLLIRTNGVKNMAKKLGNALLFARDGPEAMRRQRQLGRLATT
jgi:hypothetical protein